MSERTGWVQIALGVMALAFLAAALVAGCAAVPTGGDDDGVASVRLTGGSIPGGDDPPDIAESGAPEPIPTSWDGTDTLLCGCVDVSGAALEVDQSDGETTVALPDAGVDVAVNGMTVATGMTDEDGGFAFIGIPTGDIVVTVTPPLGRDDLEAAQAEIDDAEDGDHVSVVAVTPTATDGGDRETGTVTLSPTSATTTTNSSVAFALTSPVDPAGAVWSLKTQADADLQAGSSPGDITVVTGDETGGATVTVEVDAGAATAECTIQ